MEYEYKYLKVKAQLKARTNRASRLYQGVPLRLLENFRYLGCYMERALGYLESSLCAGSTVEAMITNPYLHVQNRW